MLEQIVWATGGAVGGIGGGALLFRFLNTKINKISETKKEKIEKLNEKKQDKSMCDERFNHLKESLLRVETKLDVGVVVAKSDLEKVVTKLDKGTEMQGNIQEEIALMLQVMRRNNNIKK